MVLCQLYGRMVDLPGFFPQYCLDLRQVMHRCNISHRDLPQLEPGQEHHALHDARLLRDRYAFVERFYGKGLML